MIRVIQSINKIDRISDCRGGVRVGRELYFSHSDQGRLTWERGINQRSGLENWVGYHLHIRERVLSGESRTFGGNNPGLLRNRKKASAAQYDDLKSEDTGITLGGPCSCV